MIKYIYIPTGNEVWFNVAVHLYKREIAQPVLWLGDDRHYSKAREFFGQCVFKKQDFVFYPERILGINYSGEYSDFFLSNHCARAKDRCVKMMDRLDLYGTFGRLDRESLFDKLAMWALKEIHDVEPTVLVTSETPHSYTQYLIYEICLYLGIEVVKFNTWNIIPILSMKNVKSGLRQKNNFVIDDPVTQKMDRDIKDYVKSVVDICDFGAYEMPYIKRQRLQLEYKNRIIRFFKYGLLALIKEHVFQARMVFSQYYYPINPYKLGAVVRYKVKMLRKKNLLKEFNRTQRTVDLHVKFVYFALHFEPERSTNPDGGLFHDQMIAIVKLRDLLPDDTLIYVKEHPSQFYNAEKGSRGRSPVFYNALDNIKGVQLVAANTNSLDLINNSVFVSTITGTAALEGAIMGKHALIFGDAWFHGCPNVILWYEGILLDDILGGRVSTHDQIIEFLLRERVLYTVPGCINHSAQTRHVEYLDEEFLRLEEKCLSDLLESFFLGLGN
ncbi:hypothetical protein OAS46_03050 [Alphaproteobacteria bacterium]|nr:hypothetical protein [Alphaproteobacteria bacterium]MDC1157098.1 hypothetical protein [Alphaproteobacteria bacterium]